MTTSATHQASVQVSMSWDQLYSPWGWQQMGLSPVQIKFWIEVWFCTNHQILPFFLNNIFEFIFTRAQPALNSIFHKNSHQKKLPYDNLDVEDFAAICSHGIVVEGIFRQASDLRVRVLSLPTTRSLADPTRICDTHIFSLGKFGATDYPT